ncbi:chorismate mutase [Microbispora cellulosiformans]|uniref:chorismate mutase n=1 Tax=Microbispora cellulosiformans TaxID=2614688 RepID=A0A5J5JWT7_9ACTN|nr:chorismate mutase [Microbispora cellulosiformans]KAA9374768.1 chorismate mutase [Microbispora cellulosiformans]
MTIHAISGAIRVEENASEAILGATAELVTAVLTRNGLVADDVVSVLLTATPDLTAAFPARGARLTGLHEVPLMCAHEPPVPGGMPRVVRLVAHVDVERPRSELRHVYLRGAEASYAAEMASR